MLRRTVRASERLPHAASSRSGSFRVRRSLRSSASRLPHRLGLLFWPAGVAMGIVAESALYGWTDARQWVPDLLAGWSLIGCGLAAWTLRPRSWCGALMTAAGFAW